MLGGTYFSSYLSIFEHLWTLYSWPNLNSVLREPLYCVESPITDNGTRQVLDQCCLRHYAPKGHLNRDVLPFPLTELVFIQFGSFPPIVIIEWAWTTNICMTQESCPVSTPTICNQYRCERSIVFIASEEASPTTCWAGRKGAVRRQDVATNVIETTVTAAVERAPRPTTTRSLYTSPSLFTPTTVRDKKAPTYLP